MQAMTCRIIKARPRSLTRVSIESDIWFFALDSFFFFITLPLHLFCLYCVIIFFASSNPLDRLVNFSSNCFAPVPSTSLIVRESFWTALYNCESPHCLISFSTWVNTLVKPVYDISVEQARQKG